MDRRARLLTAIAFAVLTALSGCSQPPDAYQFMSAAREYRQKGDNKAAAIQLQNVLQLNPSNGEARFMLGSIYNDLNDPLSAEKELRKALELDYDDAAVRPQLATSLLLQGRYKDVVEETERALNSAEVLVVRGTAQAVLGQLADADASFAKALRLEPQFAPALLGQAKLALVQGNLAESNALVDRVLAADPRNVDAWLLRSGLRYAEDKRDEAIAACGKVIEIQPDNVTARMSRATLLGATGNFDAAQADIDAARSARPKDPRIEYAQAALFFREGKPDVALESVQRVLHDYPDDMASVLLSAVLNWQLGNIQLSERQVSAFLGKYPGSVYARKLHIITLLRQNETQRALDELQVALKAEPEDPYVLALAGETYQQAKQFATATNYFQKAAAIKSTDAELRKRVALMQLTMLDPGRAIPELESAVDLQKGLSNTDTLLIMTYLRERQYDKALEASLKMQQKDPNNPLAYNLVGGAYLGKRDVANARKNLERALSLQPDYLPAALVLSSLDLEANSPEAARRRFKTILAKDPKNVGAMVGLASVERATGNVKGYVSWLEKARGEDTLALAPRLLLASYYLRANDAKSALEVANEARAIQPKHPDVLNAVAEAQTAGGDPTGAAATYAALVASVPESPLAHYRLAMAKVAVEDYLNAETSLKRALQLKPKYEDARAALSLVEYKLGHYDEALKLARQLQKDNPKLATGYAVEGDILIAQKQYPAAAGAYEKAFARRASGTLAAKWHAALTQSGRTREANEKMAKWLAEHPDDTTARLQFADTLTATRQYQPALDQYEQVLKKDPKNVLALANAAVLYRRNNDPRALDYLERSYKLVPDNMTVADSFGWVLVERGKISEGVEVLQTAATKAPDNGDVRYHLAAALAQSGDEAAARVEVQRALDGNRPFAYRDDAEALLRKLDAPAKQSGG
jgi:putative PEP-CTERM system TPR-repeat lipoprotein